MLDPDPLINKVLAAVYVTAFFILVLDIFIFRS